MQSLCIVYMCQKLHLCVQDRSRVPQSAFPYPTFSRDLEAGSSRKQVSGKKVGSSQIRMHSALLCRNNQFQQRQGTPPSPTSWALRAQLDISETGLISGCFAISHTLSCLQCNQRVSEEKQNTRECYPRSFKILPHLTSLLQVSSIYTISGHSFPQSSR